MTPQQFAEVFGGSQSTAAGAATAGSGGFAGALGGSPTGGVTADDTSSTTPTLDQQATADNAVDEPAAAGAPAVTDTDQGAGGTPAPEGTNAGTATTTIPAAIDPGGSNASAANAPLADEEIPVQVAQEPAPELELAPANDNSPTEQLAATGTE